MTPEPQRPPAMVRAAVSAVLWVLSLLQRFWPEAIRERIAARALEESRLLPGPPEEEDPYEGQPLLDVRYTGETWVLSDPFMVPVAQAESLALYVQVHYFSVENVEEGWTRLVAVTSLEGTYTEVGRPLWVIGTRKFSEAQVDQDVSDAVLSHFKAWARTEREREQRQRLRGDLLKSEFQASMYRETT